MLLLDRQTGAYQDDTFANIASHLRPGDLLVLNDSRVIPARLFARRTLVREREKPSGRIEVMLTEPVPDASGANQWHALVRPSRKVAIGERLVFPAPDGGIALEAEVIKRGHFGERLLEFVPLPILTTSIPSSTPSATSRFRLTFTATTLALIATAIRLSLRASVAR